MQRIKHELIFMLNIFHINRMTSLEKQNLVEGNFLVNRKEFKVIKRMIIAFC